MASVLGKRKAPSGASLAKKPPTPPVASTRKAKKKSGSTKSTQTAAAAAATAAKVVKAKRKEQETQEIIIIEEEEGQDPAVADAQEVFRRHFEASFKPLPDGKPKPKSKSESKKDMTEVEQAEEEEKEEEEEEEEEKEEEEEEEGDEEGDDEDLEEDVGADGKEAEADEDDEWSGLSGDDSSEVDDEEEAEENVVQVVDHSSSTPAPVASMSKRELKAFMSSKPPTQTSPKPVPTTTTADDATDDNEKSNLANDLALQRLLSESHLLSRHAVTPFSNPTAASKTFASGRLRARQTDLRAQALAPGVKSLFAQDKMPMAMRKGLKAHAAGRDAKRRRQARENGVVLEREAPAAGATGRQNNKRSGGRADRRSVDGPGVGRMRGAQLTLSERDVRSIEGPVRGGGGRGGGRGGRGGGRGGRR